MKAQDLRIGNLFTQKGSQFVEVATFETFELLSRGAILIESIPLTEDWLLKIGFKLMKETEYTLDTYEINGVQIWCPDRDRFNTGKHLKYDPLMKYVHQLQNRYFSKTGKELTINP